MDDLNSSRFKIRFDETVERPDVPVQDELADLQIEKLKKRINLLSTLLLILIGGGILIGYLDIRKRFDKIHGSETAEIQTISKDLESRFSSLSIKQAKLESQLTNKFSDIEKVTLSFRIRMKKIEQVLNNFKSLESDNEKKLSNKIADVNHALLPVKKELKKFESEVKGLEDEVKGLENRVSKKFLNLNASYEKTKNEMSRLKELNKMKKDITALSSVKLDKRMFDLAIRHEEKISQKKFNLLQKSLSDQMAAIQKKINAIESLQKKIPEKAPTSSPVKKTPSPIKKQNKGQPPKSGSIIEKDIQ
jgi:chromosome segregation ATPase